MAKKLVATFSLLVALAVVAIAYGGKPRAQHAAARAAAPAQSARRPVAMVPGLQYDPQTMIPRGISGAVPGPARV